MLQKEEPSPPQPVFVSDEGVMLDVCGWHVPAGFPSPAADHAQERIDLNKQLIRNSLNSQKSDTDIIEALDTRRESQTVR